MDLIDNYHGFQGPIVDLIDNYHGVHSLRVGLIGNYNGFHDPRVDVHGPRVDLIDNYHGFHGPRVDLIDNVAQVGLLEGWIWSKVALIGKNHVFYRSKGGSDVNSKAFQPISTRSTPQKHLYRYI